MNQESNDNMMTLNSAGSTLTNGDSLAIKDSPDTSNAVVIKKCAGNLESVIVGNSECEASGEVVSAVVPIDINGCTSIEVIGSEASITNGEFRVETEQGVESKPDNDSKLTSISLESLSSTCPAVVTLSDHNEITDVEMPLVNGEAERSTGSDPACDCNLAPSSPVPLSSVHSAINTVSDCKSNDITDIETTVVNGEVERDYNRSNHGCESNLPPSSPVPFSSVHSAVDAVSDCKSNDITDVEITAENEGAGSDYNESNHGSYNLTPSSPVSLSSEHSAVDTVSDCKSNNIADIETAIVNTEAERDNGSNHDGDSNSALCTSAPLSSPGDSVCNLKSNSGIDSSDKRSQSLSSKSNDHSTFSDSHGGIGKPISDSCTSSDSVANRGSGSNSPWEGVVLDSSSDICIDNTSSIDRKPSSLNHLTPPSSLVSQLKVISTSEELSLEAAITEPEEDNPLLKVIPVPDQVSENETHDLVNTDVDISSPCPNKPKDGSHISVLEFNPDVIDKKVMCLEKSRNCTDYSEIDSISADCDKPHEDVCSDVNTKQTVNDPSISVDNVHLMSNDGDDRVDAIYQGPQEIQVNESIEMDDTVASQNENKSIDDRCEDTSEPMNESSTEAVESNAASPDELNVKMNLSSVEIKSDSEGMDITACDGRVSSPKPSISLDAQDICDEIDSIVVQDSESVEVIEDIKNDLLNDEDDKNMQIESTVDNMSSEIDKDIKSDSVVILEDENKVDVEMEVIVNGTIEDNDKVDLKDIDVSAASQQESIEVQLEDLKVDETLNLEIINHDIPKSFDARSTNDSECKTEEEQNNVTLEKPCGVESGGKTEKVCFKKILNKGVDDIIPSTKEQDTPAVASADDDVILLDENEEQSTENRVKHISNNASDKYSISSTTQSDVLKVDEPIRKRAISNDETADSSPKRSRLDSCITKSEDLVDDKSQSDMTKVITNPSTDLKSESKKTTGKEKLGLTLTSVALRGLIIASLKSAIHSYKAEKTHIMEERMTNMESANSLWKESAKQLEKSVEELSKFTKEIDKRRNQSQKLKHMSSHSVGVQTTTIRPNVTQSAQPPKQINQPPKATVTQAPKQSPNTHRSSANLSLPPSSFLLNQNTPRSMTTSNFAPQTPRMGNPGIRPNTPMQQQVRAGHMTPNSFSPQNPDQNRQRPLRHIQNQQLQNQLVQYPQARPSGFNLNHSATRLSHPRPVTPVNNRIEIDLTDDDDTSKKSPQNIGRGPQPVCGRMPPSQSSNIQRAPPNSSHTKIVSPAQNSQGLGASASRTGYIPGGQGSGGPTRQTTAINQVVRSSGPQNSGRPAGLQKQPAPFPNDVNRVLAPGLVPPKPSLKISRVLKGIVLSWNMPQNSNIGAVTSYQLFAYQESSGTPNSTAWKKVGDVKALPLPMACTLTQFQEGNKYYFAVRAVDQYGRWGDYSEPSCIYLYPDGANSEAGRES